MAIARKEMVCERLKVDATTLDRWHNSGYLVYAAPGAYRHEDVDRFLASIAQNYGRTPPTWKTLSQETLLDSAEVAKLYGISAERLHVLCNRFPVPYLRFPGVGATRRYRFSQQSVEQLRVLLKPAVSSRLAARAFGYIVPWHVFRVTGIEMAVGRKASRKTRRFVSAESFYRCLRERLPSWVDPDDWLDDCQAIDEPLLSPRQVAELLGWRDRSRGKAKLERQRAWYITRPKSGGTEMLVSPLWVRSQRTSERPCGLDDVARLFGVSRYDAMLWRARCPVVEHRHAKENVYLLPSCWAAFMRASCSPPLKPYIAHFVTHRLLSDNPLPLLSSADVASRLGVSEFSVIQMAERGEL